MLWWVTLDQRFVTNIEIRNSFVYELKTQNSLALLKNLGLEKGGWWSIDFAY